MHIQTKRVAQAVASVLAVLGTATALGAGFQINEVSPSLQGEALAGAAAIQNDPSAMAFNPATLATVKDTQIYLGSSYIIPHVGYTGATSSFGGVAPDGTITSQASIAPAAFVPDGYFATTLPHRIHLGLAITAPWGLTTQYSPAWVGAANAIDSAVSTVNIAPTIAWQIDPYLAIGAALNAESMSVQYSSDIAQNGVNDLGNDLVGNAWGFGYSLGLLAQPFSTTSIGVGYHSKVVEQITGKDNISSVLTPINGTALPVHATITLPQVVDIGLTQKFGDKWTGLATAQWTGWNSMQSIAVYNNSSLLLDTPLYWEPSWLYSLGAEYQLNSKWVLRAGTAFDGTPTQDQYRDARIPDSDRYWLAVGAGYTPVKNITLNMAYEHIFMMPQNINVTQTVYAPGGLTSTVTNNYSGHADIIAGSVNWTF